MNKTARLWEDSDAVLSNLAKNFYDNIQERHSLQEGKKYQLVFLERPSGSL